MKKFILPLIAIMAFVLSGCEKGKNEPTDPRDAYVGEYVGQHFACSIDMYNEKNVKQAAPFVIKEAVGTISIYKYGNNLRFKSSYYGETEAYVNTNGELLVDGKTTSGETSSTVTHGKIMIKDGVLEWKSIIDVKMDRGTIHLHGTGTRDNLFVKE